MKYRVIYNPKFICLHSECHSPFHFYMEIRFFLFWFGVKGGDGELLHSPLPSEFEIVAKSLAPKMEKLRDIISIGFISILIISTIVIAKLKGVI